MQKLFPFPNFQPLIGPELRETRDLRLWNMYVKTGTIQQYEITRPDREKVPTSVN